MFLMNNYKTAILLVIGLVIVAMWISPAEAAEAPKVEIGGVDLTSADAICQDAKNKADCKKQVCKGEKPDGVSANATKAARKGRKLKGCGAGAIFQKGPGGTIMIAFGAVAGLIFFQWMMGGPQVAAVGKTSAS